MINKEIIFKKSWAKNSFNNKISIDIFRSKIKVKRKAIKIIWWYTRSFNKISERF